MILTEQETMVLRERIKTILSVGVHCVLFEKANGEVRTMFASRDELEVKYENNNPATEVRSEPRESVRAFDTKLGQWRSFRLDKVISVDGTPVERLLLM